MIWISTVFLLLVVISFLSSLCASVIFSLSPAFIEVKAETKSKSGKLIKHITDNIDRSIFALRILNTASHIVGSALMTVLSFHLLGHFGLTLLALALTLTILIVAEALPKSLGQNHAKSLAVFAAYTTQTLIIVFYPLVKISEWISTAIPVTDDIPDVTRDEVIKSAEIGAEEGTIKTKESNIIRNLLKLDKIYVSDIMTPRSVITALEATQTVEEVARKYNPLRFSRLPVYTNSLDNIIGMTHRYKILEALSKDQHQTKIQELIAPIQSVSERMSVSQVLDFFIKEKCHLTLVSDEYGITTGLVTLEDAVETLLGVEIVDEFDSIEDMRKYALDQWQQRKSQGRR
ncbi:CNNM domain-containing protein [Pseudobdellovibrio exovorus]|uniref:Mg2+ and Co2+ transporter n=1 Tax=Pseudobdellovibrio exovorus JSS TaxID=1184267 RepID=M4VAJ0_9BACT|nr:CNNM domain-containing protein [Pseudobdellovibrio exovorus]AGH95021.1 Mg2+ and Co2+ transporter [Pseudobdellovibrio exovorus JSS]